MNKADNIPIVLGFCDAWHSKNLDKVMSFLAEDCFYHNVPWAPVIGHDPIRATLQSYMDGAQEVDVVFKSVAQATDGTVLTERIDRFLIGGTWKDLPVMGAFEVKHGKITRWCDYFDGQQALAMIAGASGERL